MPPPGMTGAPPPRHLLRGPLARLGSARPGVLRGRGHLRFLGDPHQDVDQVDGPGSVKSVPVGPVVPCTSAHTDSTVICCAAKQRPSPSHEDGGRHAGPRTDDRALLILRRHHLSRPGLPARGAHSRKLGCAQACSGFGPGLAMRPHSGRLCHSGVGQRISRQDERGRRQLETGTCKGPMVVDTCISWAPRPGRAYNQDGRHAISSPLSNKKPRRGRQARPRSGRRVDFKPPWVWASNSVQDA